MTLAGFAAIVIGSFRITGPASFAALATVLLLYGVTTLIRAYGNIVFGADGDRLIAIHALAFALLKLAFTFIFCFIVMSYAKIQGRPPGDDRVRPASKVYETA